MNCPPDFHRYCGPQALAVAIGGGWIRAARGLLAMQRMRGRHTAPYVHDDDLVLLVMRAGFHVERWSVERPEPRLQESADELAARLRAELARDRAAPPAQTISFTAAWEELAPTIADPVAMVEGWRTEAAARCFTLREWLTRPGFWLLAVRHTLFEGVPSGHYVAARDGRVVAGDSADASTHGALSLASAYKISPHEE